MTEELFLQRVEKLWDGKLELVLNENRSTMLSLLERGNGYAKLSMHKMFLDAPDHVVESIVHYVTLSRKDRKIHNSRIRGFIQENHRKYAVRMEKVDNRGSHYHLQELYNAINKEYFAGRLDVAISWFGRRSKKKNRRHITYGKYVDCLHLIQIHKDLDNPFYPEFFVRFIIYHEMLHAVIPSYMDENGRCRMHGPEFKEKERLFKDYRQAIAWEKENKDTIFGVKSSWLDIVSGLISNIGRRDRTPKRARSSRKSRKRSLLL